jgi:hypothetical protein
MGFSKLGESSTDRWIKVHRLPSALAAEHTPSLAGRTRSLQLPMTLTASLNRIGPTTRFRRRLPSHENQKRTRPSAARDRQLGNESQAIPAHSAFGATNWELHPFFAANAISKRRRFFVCLLSKMCPVSGFLALVLLPAKNASAQSADTPYQVGVVTEDLAKIDTTVAMTHRWAGRALWQNLGRWE